MEEMWEFVPKIKKKKIPCIWCKKEFMSRDYKRIRYCPKCNIKRLKKIRTYSPLLLDPKVNLLPQEELNNG